MTSRTVTILLLVVLPSIISSLFLLMDQAWGEINEGLLSLYLSGAVYAQFLRYYPEWERPEKCFEKIGFENAVSEYQFSRKLFYVTLAILILILIVLSMSRYHLYTGVFFVYGDSIRLSLNYAIWALLPSVTALGVRFASHYLKNDFDYYLAKAYFKATRCKAASIA
jgi:hypothetical protein